MCSPCLVFGKFNPVRLQNYAPADASTSYTIIDEADELLHDDWEQEMTKIMGGGGM